MQESVTCAREEEPGREASKKRGRRVLAGAILAGAGVISPNSKHRQTCFTNEEHGIIHHNNLNDIKIQILITVGSKS